MEPVAPAVEAARIRTGAEAQVLISEAVNGPVTFGAWRPVVLLPSSFFEQSSEAQFGIACHEFLHVRRHDWLYTVCEEFAAALVWFHPAVWWLLGQIRLTREQVVDREVVSLAETREPYIQALLAMGGAPPQLDLAPVTLFLRKRHLSQRVHSLLKEVTMFKARLVSFCIVSAAALAATAWFVATSFPLEAGPRVEMQQGAVSSADTRDWVTIQIEGLKEPALSNMRARLAGFEGRPYSMELRAEILRAAREIEPAARISMVWQSEAADGSLQTRVVLLAGRDPLEPEGPVHIDVSSLPEPLQSTMQARLFAFEGQPYSRSLWPLITMAVSEVAPGAGVARRRAADGSLTTTLCITLPVSLATLTSVPEPPPVRVDSRSAARSSRASWSVRPDPSIPRSRGRPAFRALCGSMP